MTTKELGYAQGETCNRDACRGVIDTHPSENCSCHLAAPCGSCTSPRNFCPVCWWEERDDQVVNDFIVNVRPGAEVMRVMEPRPLDPTKIDWHSRAHTHSSMIKRGVYPEGTTREQVLEQVRGTFGGRFNHFGDGRFEYVAYTD